MSVSFLSCKTALEAELNSFWSTTAIAWENTTFDPSGYWIRPRVLTTDAVKMCYGASGTVDVVGVLAIEVFGPVDVGTGTILGYADTLCQHFSESVFGVVHTYTGFVQPRGEIDNKYQVSIQIPFNSHQAP